MTEAKMNTWIGLGILAMLVLFGYSQGVFQSFSGGESGESPKTVVEIEGACSDTTSTLTVDLEKMYSSSTSMSAENATIVVNGKEKTTKSDGASTTVSIGDIVDVYSAFVSSTYYTRKDSGTIPCKGSILTSDEATFGENAGKVYQMEAGTSGLFTVINDDGTTSNPGTAQAISAGQTKKLDVTINPTYEDGWGTVGGLVVNCQYNSTAYDNEIPVRVTQNGGELPSATPASNTLESSISTDHSRKAWKLAGIDGRKQSEVNLEVSIKADGNYNPTAGGGDVNCTVYDTDYFKNDAGTFEIGIEDSDDNSNVGLTEGSAHKFGILVS